jgi:hypothetical protein
MYQMEAAMTTTASPPGQLAGIIPEPDYVRAQLARVNAEANLLRLSLMRQREAERLARPTEQPGGPDRA